MNRGKRGEHMRKRIYVCDGTMDGIFTAVYEATRSKCGHQNIRIMEKEQVETLELFCEYLDVKTDMEKAEQVARGVQRRMSDYGYYLLCHCCLSKEKGRSDAAYRFILYGMSQGQGVVEQVAHPFVQPIYRMYRNVNNEVLHYKGFLRFEELKNGVMAARIRPENNILMLLAPHFADRFQGMNWVIVDEGRSIASFHKAYQEWIMVEEAYLEKSVFLECSEEEEFWQKTWCKFVDTIGIKDRENKALQRQMLPYRYREFMKDFQNHKSK